MSAPSGSRESIAKHAAEIARHVAALDEELHSEFWQEMRSKTDKYYHSGVAD